MKQEDAFFKELENKLELVAKTGKIIYGFNNVKWALKSRKVKLTMLASNIPREMEQELRNLCEMRRIPIFKSKFTNIELGGKCLRPHVITALAILDFGVLSQKMKGGKVA